MYSRTFDFSSDAFTHEVFAVETLGAQHREGRQFLRVHVTAIDPHSPILQLFKLHLPSVSSL